MDVELPSGVVIEDVPDGWNKAQLTNYLQAKGKSHLLASPEDVATADPTKDMGGFQRFAAGAGKAGYDIARGVGQFAGIVPQSSVDESRKLDAPLMNTGAGVAGNIAGNALIAAPAMAIPGVNTLVGGAALGAGMGALQPTAEGESRLLNMGVGAVGGTAAPALGSALRTGKALAEPLYQSGRNTIVGRTLNRVAGENAPAIQQRFASALELVPGSKPTAAEVAESGGVAALQRSASASNPEAYAHRGMEQAAARVQALRDIAGDSNQQAQMKGVRGLMSEQLYKEAGEEGVDASLAKAMKPQIDNLLQRPAMKQAVARAKQIFGEETVTLDKAGSVRGLQLTKQALDDIIEKAGGAGSSIGKNEFRALQQTRSDLISTLQDLSPKLRQADTAYASWSKPINEMQVGQELLNRLEPALSDHGALAKETGARFAQAIRNAPATMRSATGRRYSELSDVLTEPSLQKVENVAKDLARKANAQDLGRGVGSDTAQKLSMANIAEQSGMPRLINWASNLPVVSRGLNWVARESDDKIKAQLAQALLDPQRSAQLMAAARGNPQMAKALRAAQATLIPLTSGGAISYQGAQ